MDERAFIKKLLRNDYAVEEICRFFMQHYFIKDYGISDFKEDLIFKYGLSEESIKRVLEEVKVVIKKL